MEEWKAVAPDSAVDMDYCHLRVSSGDQIVDGAARLVVFGAVAHQSYVVGHTEDAGAQLFGFAAHLRDLGVFSLEEGVEVFQTPAKVVKGFDRPAAKIVV